MKQDVYERITATDRRGSGAGRAPVDEAVERGARRRADHAAPAEQRHALSGHQRPDALDGGHGAGLRRADLDDLQAGAGARARMSARARRAASSSMPTASPAPKPTRRPARRSEREIPFLKGYTVFNVEQIDGLPPQYRRQVGSELHADRGRRSVPIDTNCPKASKKTGARNAGRRRK